MIIEYKGLLGRMMKKAKQNEPHACKILITCQTPKGGKMQVEMKYDGDPTLAMYLLEQAQEILDQEIASSSCVER